MNNKAWYKNNTLSYIEESSDKDMKYTFKYITPYLTHDTTTIRHFKARDDNEAVRKIIRNNRVGFNENILDTWIEKGEISNSPQDICLKMENLKYIRKFYLRNDSMKKIIWNTFEEDVDEQYVDW